MGKTTVGDLKFVYIRDYVAPDLGSLTMRTFSGPLGDICSERGPDKFFSYHLARPLDTWVPEAVNRVKDLATP